MGKRFKGKICVYCGGVGETADHLFARQLFPEDQRANLPQVCACETCNRRKSQIEHYLLTLLPFGGLHGRSHELLTAMVPKRLAKNEKLRQTLASGKLQVQVHEDGAVRTSLALPFEPNQLNLYFGMIARGLVAYHWKAIVPHDYYAGGSLLNQEGDELYRALLTGHRRPSARGDLGSGLILYGSS